MVQFQKKGDVRYLIVLLALAGCSYNLTLYPRGGGDIVRGTANSGSKTMTVDLRGESYTGKYVQARSTGLAFTGTQSVVTSGSQNVYSALLTNGKSALRCEFMANNSGGNGVCGDSDGKVYDLQIIPQ